MPPGRIYVDLDDVLSETIQGLAALHERRTGWHVDVEAISDFDFAAAFGLGPEEFEEFMRDAHEPTVLHGLLPRTGAGEALDQWVGDGYVVSVITGRPPSSEAASRTWLERHEIAHTDLAFVDKYARPDWGGGSRPALPLDALPALGFTFAIEDSLPMAVHLAEHCALPVALLDRPWNRNASGLSRRAAESIVRVRDWAELHGRFPAP